MFDSLYISFFLGKEIIYKKQQNIKKYKVEDHRESDTKIKRQQEQ